MTRLEIEATRQRRAFASLAGNASPGPDCPEPENLWDAATGRLAVEERRRLVDHLAGCPSCAEDWRLAEEVMCQAGDEIDRVPAGSFQARVRWALVAAALLIVVVGLPVLLDRDPLDIPETVRSVAGGRAIESLVPEGVVLSRADCALAWTMAGETTGEYDLVVATEELDVLFEVKALEEPIVVVPEERLAAVPPGGRILWRVEAMSATGQATASPTFVHQLE